MSCKIRTSTGSLQGKAIQFLTKQGRKDIHEIIDTSSATYSNTKNLKNSSKLISMLEDVSDLFKKHGLWVHKNDANIMFRNANLFENLVDSKRLVDRINKKAGFKHNVISSKQFNGSYWLVTTDKAYSQEVDFATAQKRRESIIQKNLARVELVNSHFETITGRKAITLHPNKDNTAYRVEFNESVLQDFNSVSYTHYVNSMYKYLNNSEAVEEDLIISPLINKLEVEKKSLTKDKERRESQGAKKSEINTIDNQIESISKKLESLEDSQALEDVWDESTADFVEIDKLLNQDSISPAEFDKTNRKINLWIKSGDFSTENHPFLDEEEFDNDYYREKFLDIRKEAEYRSLKLSEKGEKLIEAVWNSTFGKEGKDTVSFNQIMTLTGRINFGHKQFHSLNRLGHGLAQFLHKIINEANSKAFIESKLTSRDLAEVYKKVQDSGFDMNLFYQVDNKGIKTGNMTHKFSSEFFESYKKYIYPKVSEYTKNMEFIDPLKLSSKDPKVVEEHTQNIINHLGEIEATKHIEQAQKRYQDYLDIKADFINQEFNDKVDTKEKEAILEEWIRDNSPSQRIAALQQTKKVLTKDVRGKDTFLVSFPKRVFKNGEETNWYDNTFNQIEGNEDAYTLFSIAQDITNVTRSTFGAIDFSPTSLAFIKKSLIEKYNETGIVDFLTKDAYDSLVKSLITTDNTEVTIDPLTGKEEKTIKSNLSSMDMLIYRRYKELATIAEQTKGEPLESEELQALRNTASDEVFSDASDNLFMSLNMMNLANLSLKHKHNIEDHVNLAMTYLPKSTVAVGDNYIDSAGNPVADQYITNMMQMVDHTLNMSYYGNRKADESGIITTLRTSQEKERAKVIEEELNNENISVEQKAALTSELNQMGAKVTLNTIGKKFLDFIRLKGLGWNIPAGIANLIHGTVTLWMKGADGRLFNMRDLGKASKALTTENSKFHNTVENYSILGDILFEFKETNKFEEKKNWFYKAIKSLKPYAIQTSTEKLNQGTLMVAMMLNQKVTNKETGEETSMWEAISKQGVLSDEWQAGNLSGESAVIEMVSKIKSAVEDVFGDYSNPLMYKNTLIGKTFGMYKGWLFEAIHQRVSAEKHDYIRGITTKGRYRTAFELMKKYKLRFRSAYKAYKSGEFTEVDAANMRVNLVELAGIVALYSMYLLAKSAICGEDRKCREANAAQLYTLNMSKRIFNEVSFYTNPGEWKKFISNPTAAAGILSDTDNLLDYITRRLDDDPDNHLYIRGRNQGRDRGVVLFESQIPLYLQIKRLKNYGGEFLNL